MARFEIGERDFLLDGQPHRILSGALHYFRVHPGQWADRLRAARLMGLNTIETYVAWNAHEPVRGAWDATGANDLGRFLDLVAAEGMHAIVRPGPYICAEWHNGGLPVWLTALPGIGLRRSEAQYVSEVTTYLERVYDIVAPRQLDRGGPVVLVQIENEYGAYGSDKEYLAELVRVTRAAGITVPLTTIDQPQPRMLRDGSLAGVHLTGSFGSRAGERLATLREHQSTGPLMCAEFWDGWFDWWGGVHHTTSAEDAAAELDTLLGAGASVNLYMFHGGTNFGLTNGANDKGRYLPITTSYDYDAPLDEAGRATEKYHAFRAVIAKYAPVPDEQIADASPAPSFDVPLSSSGDWLAPASGELFDEPPTFEDVGQTGALVRYDAALSGRGGLLAFGEVRDRAWVEVDGVSVGVLSRTQGVRSLSVPAGERLTVLVEEQGRVNYDVRLGEPKGLVGGATIDGERLTGWTATPIDVAALADAPSGAIGARALRRGTFALAEASDLFLDLRDGGTGYAFVNGFLLGRYGSTGPQRTLYVPSPVTSAGENTVALVELERGTAPAARFVSAPDLGPLEE